MQTLSLIFLNFRGSNYLRLLLSFSFLVYRNDEQQEQKNMKKQNLKQEDSFYGFLVYDESKCKQMKYDARIDITLVRSLSSDTKNVVGTGGVTHELIKMVEPRFKPENKENRFL